MLISNFALIYIVILLTISNNYRGMRLLLQDVLAYLLLVLYTYSQCCMRTINNVCVECPIGMHLYRSNCILDLPGCLSHSDGFDCSQCKFGYLLDSNNKTCILKSDLLIFATLNLEDITDDPKNNMLISNLTELTVAKFPESAEGLIILKAYLVNTDPKAVRLIFTNNKGFVQALFELKTPITDSILRDSKVTVIKDTQDFINTNDDTLMPYVKAEIAKNYTQISKFEIIDGFRSLDVIRGLAIYRIFLLDPNAGLRQLTVTIKIGNEVEFLDINNLPSQIKLAINNFSNVSSYAAYLQQTVLASVKKTTSHPQQKITHNMTYKHPKIILDQGPAISWINFEFNNNKSLNILNSYLYLKEIQNANNIPQITFQIINDITFVEYLDPIAIKNVNVYGNISSLLQKHFYEYVSSAYISHAAVGQNSSIFVYEVGYVQNSNAVINIFTLVVNKQNKSLRITKLVQVPLATRQIIRLSDRTRSSIISTLDQKQHALLQTIMYTEPLYSTDCKLLQITRGQAKNIRNSTSIQNVTHIFFKYYYPSPILSQAGKFEFVDFRYEIDSSSNLNILGHVQYPVQTFTNTTNTSYATSLIDTINKTLLTNANITRADVVSVMVSQNRSYTYNVLLNQTYLNRKYTSNLYLVQGNQAYELKQTNFGDAPVNQLPSLNSTNKTNITVTDNYTLSEQQILNSSTLSILLDFIIMQFIVDVQNKILVQAKQVNKSNDTYTIYDITYAELTTTAAGFKLILGISMQFGNIIIIDISNTTIQQKAINQGKQRYKNINKYILPDLSNNNNNNKIQPKVNNQSIIPTAAQLAIKLVPQLLKMYTSLTSTPINDSSLAVLVTNTTLIVQQPTFRQYQFSIGNKLPKVSTIQQPRLTIGNQLNQDIIKNIIHQMVGIDINNINSIRVTGKTTLLDTIDTCVVQFTTATLDNTTNQINTSVNKTKSNVSPTNTSNNSGTTFKIVSDGVIPLLPNTVKKINKSEASNLNQSNTLQNNAVNNTTNSVLLSTGSNATAMQTVMFQIVSKLKNTSNTNSLLLTKKMPINLFGIPNSITSTQSSLYTAKSIPVQSMSIKNSSSSWYNANSSLVLQFMPLRYSQSHVLNLPYIADMKPQVTVSQLNQLPESIVRRYPKRLYPISKRIHTNSTIVLYTCVHYKYGIMNMWYDTKTDILLSIQYIDIGYYLSGSDYIDMQYISKQIVPIQRIAAADLTNMLHKLNITFQSKHKYSNNSSIDANKLVLWKVKSIENIKQVELWYDIQDYTIKMNYLLASSTNGALQLAMLQFESFDNNFTNLKNSNLLFKQNKINNISNTSQFKECQKLLKFNSDIYLYMRNSEIVDIMLKQYNGQMQYYVIYSTPYGPVDARLTYNIKNKTAKLLSFTQPKQRPSTGTDKGCILAAGIGCKECSEEYYLHNDAHCYSRIIGCTFQSGGYCLQCDPGLIKSFNKCL